MCFMYYELLTVDLWILAGFEAFKKKKNLLFQSCVSKRTLCLAFVSFKMNE